ncbi:hypothetical protein [Leuconostoc citreum]
MNRKTQMYESERKTRIIDGLYDYAEAVITKGKEAVENNEGLAFNPTTEVKSTMSLIKQIKTSDL